jgi:hypothetical protein
MSNKEETLVLYYGVRQLTTAGNVRYVNLHEDRDRKRPVGKAVYVADTVNLRSIGKSYAIETGTFFLGKDEKDVIYFQDNSTTTDGVLPEGRTVYQILGGQGRYLGATGLITFEINKAGLRTMTLRIKLA